MQVTVKLFGPQAQAAGRREVTVDAEESPLTCATLRELLAEAEPALRPSLAQCRLAVNHAFAGEEQAIDPGDEVALIGMVSGG